MARIRSLMVPLERFNDVITDVNLPPSAQVELKGRALR